MEKQLPLQLHGLRACWKQATAMPTRHFVQLQEAVAGTVERPQLDALGASINDFDFEAALLKLDEIAESCKQTEDQAK